MLPCHFHLPFYIQPNTNNTTLCSFNRRSFDLVSLSLSLPHIPLFARRHPPFTSSNDIVLPRSSYLLVTMVRLRSYVSLSLRVHSLIGRTDYSCPGETVVFTYVFHLFVFSHFPGVCCDSSEMLFPDSTCVLKALRPDRHRYQADSAASPLFLFLKRISVCLFSTSCKDALSNWRMVYRRHVVLRL